MNEPSSTEPTVSSVQAEYDTLRHVTSEVPCPYLPGRQGRSEVYRVDGLAGATYERLMARGFRRSGHVVYRPRCRGCHECRQLRVPVAQFVPTASMRRVKRRNADVGVEVGAPQATTDAFAIYQQYLDAQHDGAMSRGYEAFREFLYESPLETLEFRYRLGERLIGVSIADRCPNGLSSVYMYFDPAFASRSLGTFSILWEIDWCVRNGLGQYYLGFYVADSKTMSYKARFRPHEVLVGDDRWIACACRVDALRA